VRNGSGSIDGKNSATVVSDPDGRAAVTLTLGPQEGDENNEVVATFVGNATVSAIFTASGRVPKSITETRVSGVVLDNSEKPIAGVTVRLLKLNQGSTSGLPQQVGTAAIANESGYFELIDAPAGVYKLLVDGKTAAGPQIYPTLEYDITTVAGQNNTLGMPIYLPALGSSGTLCVDSANGGVLTLADAPGFSLTVLPGAATFPGGSKTGCISVTQVNLDKVPMVPGFGQQPRFIVTIQPVGTAFSPPAAISIPNVDGLAPGAITEMYSYDHDLASFVSIGNAQVSSDGSTISSVAGSGVVKAGWHCGGNPNPSGHVGGCKTCKHCVDGACRSDDTLPCDDNKFCTSCNGLFTETTDCCRNGACKGKQIEEIFNTSDLAFPNKLLAALQRLADFSAGILSLTGRCQVSPPSFSADAKVSTGIHCCETDKKFVEGERTTATAGINLGSTCSFSLLPPANLIPQGVALVFAFSGGGTAGVQGTYDRFPSQCTGAGVCSGSGTVHASLQGGFTVLQFGGGSLLDVSAYLKGSSGILVGAVR
jgi:hypothetical protein